jgi:chemotaxis receptor (MCP) glutamine deamidase CheD
MVETQLRAAGIPIIGRHLGGERGRRITFDLESGEVVVEIQGKEVARL